MSNRSKTKGISFSAPSYVDLDPQCDSHKEEGVETLIVHLPGFKKDQLRVRVNDRGDLKINGEKIDDEKRVTRFLKETKIPQGCNIHDIRAKFKNGCLHIIMPTKVSTLPQVQHQNDDPAPAISGVPEGQTPRMANSVCYQARNQMTGKVGSWLTKSMSLGIATVVIVAFGAYYAYSNVNLGV